jgi:hypothetical protein
VTERNVSLFFAGELENDHYEALLLVMERQKFSVFAFVSKICQKHFIQTGAA